MYIYHKYIIRLGWDCCCCQVKMLVSSRLLSRSLQLIPDSIAKSQPKATAIQTSLPIELMVFINPPMRAFTDAVTLSHHFIFVEMDRAKTHTRAKKRQNGEKMARIRLRERWENEAPEREGGKRGGGVWSSRGVNLPISKDRLLVEERCWRRHVL